MDGFDGLTDAPQMPPELAVDSIAQIAGTLRAQFGAVADDIDRTAAAWRAARAELLARATPADDRDIALLERVASTDLPPDHARPLVEGALAAAERAGDEAEALRCRAQLELLDAVAGDDSAPGRVAAVAEELESAGHAAYAGAVWRIVGDLSEGERAVTAYLRSAEGSARAGEPWRQSHALASAGRAAAPLSLDRAEELAVEAERLAAGHPGMHAHALDLRWRLAAAREDLDTAIELARRQADLPGLPTRMRLGALASVCDLLVDTSSYPELAPAADRLLALAADAGDPLMLALGQRFLGVALVESGRHDEAAPLLAAALPVLTERAPDLVGPVGWALGSALVGLGEWGGARTAFATAAASFEAHDRVGAAGAARLRAGHAAWDAEELPAAQAHYAAAVELAARAGDPATFLDAARSLAQAHGRPGAGEVEAALAELDSVPDRTLALIDEAGLDRADWDVDAIRPAVLRQGALLLEEHGRHGEAAVRFEQAEMAVTDDMVLAQVLRSERGAALARAGDLDEAERVLRPTLAGMSDDALDGARIEAAAAWASALAAAGRPEDADAVWAELGPRET